MPSRVVFRALLLLSLLAAALAACDSSDDGDPVDGTFSATLSGHVKAGLRGPAAFTVGTEDGQSLLAIGLFNSADPEDAVFLVLDGRPTVKRYAVADETAWALVVLPGTGAEGAFYLASAGSVTVTRADAARLSGSFDVTAVNLVDDTDRVRVRGTFSATPGQVEVPDAGEAFRRAAT